MRTLERNIRPISFIIFMTCVGYAFNMPMGFFVTAVGIIALNTFAD